jgi:hypothetical protein
MTTETFCTRCGPWATSWKETRDCGGHGGGRVARLDPAPLSNGELFFDWQGVMGLVWGPVVGGPLLRPLRPRRGRGTGPDGNLIDPHDPAVNKYLPACLRQNGGTTDEESTEEA